MQHCICNPHLILLNASLLGNSLKKLFYELNTEGSFFFSWQFEGNLVSSEGFFKLTKQFSKHTKLSSKNPIL